MRGGAGALRGVGTLFRDLGKDWTFRRRGLAVRVGLTLIPGGWETHAPEVFWVAVGPFGLSPGEWRGLLGL